MGVKELHAKVSSVVKNIKEKNPHLFSEDSIFSNQNNNGRQIIIFSDKPSELVPFIQAFKYSVSGIEYNHNSNQPLPEIIGEWFDLNELDIEGYKAGDCTCKSPKLTWYHFKRVQKFNDTRHLKTKVRAITVLAWTEKEYNAPVLLICKIKR